MTTHVFFQVHGIRVTSDIFPAYHSRPVDPYGTADALNRLYNAEYTAALHSNDPGHIIPPDKALQIAYFFQVHTEIARAKENAVIWIDDLNPGTSSVLQIHLKNLAILPRISGSQLKATRYISSHI